MHGDQPRGARGELIEQRDVDPVAGVDDDVCAGDRTPDDIRQIARPLGHVRVRHDQKTGGHTTSRSRQRSGVTSWKGRPGMTKSVTPSSAPQPTQRTPIAIHDTGPAAPASPGAWMPAATSAMD